ncbi:MAG TPA: hypothetical protein VF911_04570 [Thermoanaerobaculia bacterium]
MRDVAGWHVRFEPPCVAIGERVSMQFVLRSTSTKSQALLVDVAVHFVQARGTSAKVFKLERLTLPPRGSIELATRFSLAVHTTRVPRPGRHAVDVIVNGKAHSAAAFEVVE